MYVVIFYSRLKLNAPGYEDWAEQMLRLVTDQPGFSHSHSFRNADGFGVTLSYWVSVEAIEDWGRLEAHRRAQIFGRTDAYSEYRIERAQIISAGEWTAEVGNDG